MISRKTAKNGLYICWEDFDLLTCPDWSGKTQTVHEVTWAECCYIRVVPENLLPYNILNCGTDKKKKKTKTPSSEQTNVFVN